MNINFSLRKQGFHAFIGKENKSASGMWVPWKPISHGVHLLVVPVVKRSLNVPGVIHGDSFPLWVSFRCLIYSSWSTLSVCMCVCACVRTHLRLENRITHCWHLSLESMIDYFSWVNTFKCNYYFIYVCIFLFNLRVKKFRRKCRNIFFIFLGIKSVTMYICTLPNTWHVLYKQFIEV